MMKKYVLTLILVILCVAVSPGQAEVRILPQPHKVQWKEGQLRLNQAFGVTGVTGEVAARVQDTLRAMRLPVSTTSGVPFQINLMRTSKQDLTSTADQAYRLEVDARRIRIRAGGEAGLDYALATLEQLIRHDERGAYLPFVEIDDEPAMAMRGVYLNLRQVKATEPHAIAELHNLIDSLASIKINTLMIEVSDNLRYDSHRFPAREKTAFTKQQIRELVAYANSRHMEVIPYLQTLSHVNWILSNPKNESLLEDPSNKGWHTAWCPSMSETEAFIEDILRETFEAFEPRYMHVGLDEVNWGPYHQCHRCRPQEPSKIFLDEIMHLHGFLARHGVRMMMFHDDLLEVPNRYSRHNKNAAAVEGWKIRDRLPKDIILNTYFYSVDRPELKRQVDLFTGLGFQVIGMPFNVLPGIKQSADRMGEEPQALGNILSYWHYAGDWSRQAISPESFASTTLLADLCWNPSSQLETLGYDPVWEFARRWKNLQPTADGVPLASYPIELSNHFNQRIFSTRGTWPASVKVVADLYADSRLNLDGMQFILGEPDSRPNAIVLSGAPGDGFSTEPVTLGVHRQVGGLAFVHASDVPANVETLRQKNRNTPQLATYTFVYSDGTRVEQPIRYGVEITEWNDRLSPTDGRTALQAYDDQNRRIMFTRWIWTNPHPEKRLQHVTLASSQYEQASIAVLAATALAHEKRPVEVDTMEYTSAQAFQEAWKLSRVSMPQMPQLNAQPRDWEQDGPGMEIRVPATTGAQVARINLDRPIPPPPASDGSLTLTIFLEHDSPATVQYGVYLAETKGDGGWGRSLQQFLKLRPGINHVRVTPQMMKPAGEMPDPHNLTQLRLAFWFPADSPRARLVLGPIQWQPQGIGSLLYRGTWFE